MLRTLICLEVIFLINYARVPFFIELVFCGQIVALTDCNHHLKQHTYFACMSLIQLIDIPGSQTYSGNVFFSISYFSRSLVPLENSIVKPRLGSNLV